MLLKLSSKLTLFLFGVLVCLLACKETPPGINYEESLEALVDTTYLITDLPTPQKKNVLLEDVSGVRCVNCPEANQLAADIQKNAPEGRVAVVTLHPWSYKTLTTPYKENDTLNTQVAEEIFTTIFEPQSLPVGAVNRKKFPGEQAILQATGVWQNSVNQELNQDARVNLDFEILNQTEEKVTVSIKTTFLDTLPGIVNYSIMVLESGIIGKQSTNQGGGVINQYEHNHVLRDMLTPYNGELLVNDPEKGRVFEKQFELDIDRSKINNLANCSLVVYVNRNSSESFEVIQVKELKLKG